MGIGVSLVVWTDTEGGTIHHPRDRERETFRKIESLADNHGYHSSSQEAGKASLDVFREESQITDGDLMALLSIAPMPWQQNFIHSPRKAPGLTTL